MSRDEDTTVYAVPARRRDDSAAARRRRSIASAKPASGYAPGGGRHVRSRQAKPVSLPRLSCLDDPSPDSGNDPDRGPLR